MEILKRRFFKKRKQPMQKEFVATAVGYVPWGDGAEEYFYNLYEYEDGTRECEKFDGGQYYTTPENAPLIDEINREIKKLSKTAGNKYVYR
ncbi:hypothetical protein [Bartonella sp. AP6QHHD]|uniref:hypothetical protein n=1 Tax=Bartonella sp. AP6QHHD TaxID=3243501 RepID=UPI0035D1175B